MVAVFQCMRACGLPRRIELGGSGCCGIVRARCLPVSAWYGLGAGRKCATGCHARRWRGTGAGSKEVYDCG